MSDVLDRSDPALSVPGRVWFLFLYPLLAVVVVLVVAAVGVGAVWWADAVG
ncbi:hypothetical protein ACFWZ7_15355 [Nocardiopsis alba]|uniref:hypothetical protein n=1 Tax=Nocardiopsis alba TaxID=53437 RepID=UPI00366EE659